MFFRFFLFFSCSSLFANHSVQTATPMDSLSKLREGNFRFISGEMKHPNQNAERRKETFKDGQKPYVTILSCSDSRVPVETIFDAGIGDLFTVRVAGNVADTDEIGTIEYGVEHLGTPLLLILGHTKCGAVTAVTEGARLGGSLPKLVDNIEPAVSKAKKEHPNLKGADLVAEAIKDNVWQAMEDIFKGSEIVRELVKEKKVEVMGAVYDLDSGKITYLGKHPQEAKLIESEQKKIK